MSPEAGVQPSLPPPTVASGGTGLILAAGGWALLGAVVVALGYSLREGGVRAGTEDLSAFISPVRLIAQAAVLGLAFLVTHLAIRRLAPRSDPWLLPAVSSLCAAGWVYLAVLAPDLASFKGKKGLAGLGGNHLKWILIGLLACAVAVWATRRGLIRRLLRLRYLMALAYLALVVATAVFGERREMGAYVLVIAGQNVQTVEIAKYLLMFFAAGYLAQEARWIRDASGLRWRVVLPYLIIGAVGLGPILYPLREVGPTALIGLALLALLYAGTRSLGLFAAFLASGGLTGFLAWWIGWPDIVRERVDAFLEPFAHEAQMAHGLWALAAGGVSGVGLTHSAAWRIPVAESDFAYAGWVEMTGFVGGAGLLLLYGVICWRGLEVARRANDRFEAGLVLGFTTVLAAQVVMIVAGNLAWAPLTGITVPFVSHGGISLATNFVAVGVILGVRPADGPELPNHSWTPAIPRIEGAWAVLLAVLVVGTWLRSVGQADGLELRVFVDAARQGRLQDAADAGAVMESPNGGTALDPTRIADLGLSNRVRRDLERQLGAETITWRGGEPSVAATCCSVRNPRTTAAGSQVRRGRILDARGRSLAETVQVPGSTRTARVYPFGAPMFAVTGLSSPLLNGAAGAEALFDDVLRGDAPASARRATSRLLARLDRGDDVQLTVDAGLSELAWRWLQADPSATGRGPTGRGAVVVLDATTGEILVAVGSPSWDPNEWTITEGEGEEDSWTYRDRRSDWQEAGFDREARARTARAFDARYPPGSTMKLLTAGAWLESGNDPEHRVRCQARQRAAPDLPACHPHFDHSEPDLVEAVAESCNAWFGQAGIDLGPAVLPFAEALGFGRGWDLGGGILGRAWETLPSVAWRQGTGPADPPWDATFFARNPKKASRSAIGQDTVEATPLQVALLGAAVAGEGLLHPPLLVSSVRAAPEPGRPEDLGAAWARANTPVPSRVFSEDTAETLAAGMRLMMTEGTGSDLPRLVRGGDGHVRAVARSAVPAGADLVVVAGKTGTADICVAPCSIRPHAWTVVWAPAEDGARGPRPVVSVLIENGGSGAAGAAAMDMLAQSLNWLGGGGPDPVPVDLRRRVEPTSVETLGSDPADLLTPPSSPTHEATHE